MHVTICSWLICPIAVFHKATVIPAFSDLLGLVLM